MAGVTTELDLGSRPPVALQQRHDGYAKRCRNLASKELSLVVPTLSQLPGMERDGNDTVQCPELPHDRLQAGPEIGGTIPLLRVLEGLDGIRDPPGVGIDCPCPCYAGIELRTQAAR